MAELENTKTRTRTPVEKKEINIPEVLVNGDQNPTTTSRGS